MKRIFVLLQIVLVCLMAEAQENAGRQWFVSANLTGSAFYGNEEIDHDFAKSPFKGFRNSLGVSLSVGRWFSPEIALRTKVYGFSGRYVISEDTETNAIKCMVLDEQVLLDVTNIFGGYDAERRYHLIPFFGAGFGRNMTYNRWATNLSIGILNQFRLTDSLFLNAELGLTMHTREFTGHDERKYNYHSFANEDRQFMVEVGVTYNFK